MRSVVCLLLTLAACGLEPPCGPSTATVAEVVDGDTLALSSGQRVRYLLVDTPETHGRRECFGPEAHEYNRALVAGRTVTLSYGEACTDRYGRLLAYVSVGGREVNSLLVQQGLACVLYIPPAGTARRAELLSLETQARRARRGLWGACAPLPCGR
jgi:micrococcal nuclease